MIDPAECRRLAEICAEDDARMTPGPWIGGADSVVLELGTVVAEIESDDRRVEALAIARTRNNLRAIASALTDAAEMAERHEKLEASCNSAWAQVEVVTKERDNARWADRTRRKAVEAIIAERDAARAEIERLRAGIRLEIERHPTSLGEETSAGEELRRLVGDA